MKKSGLLLVCAALVASCSNSNKESVAEGKVEIKLAPVEIAENQKLVGEFPEIYYYMESADTSAVDKYNRLLKFDRKTFAVDTIYSVAVGESVINSVMSPDSAMVIVEEMPVKGGYNAYCFKFSVDSLKNIASSQNSQATAEIDFENNQIKITEQTLIFAPSQYASSESVYSLNGDVVKKGSLPTPKISAGNYYFSGTAKMARMGLTGDMNLTFSVDSNNNISGSGKIFGTNTGTCELKGQMSGNRVEIKAYYRGRLLAKMDLKFKISSGKNVLSGTMMDDDYSFDVYMTGRRN